MKTKKTSFLARAAMTLLVTMLTATTAWADTYKITFHLNGGTYEWNIDSYEDGDEFNLMTAAREDAIFKGWYTTKTFEEGTRIAEVTGRTGDLEVWAKWECAPVTYIDENGEEQTTTEYIELKGSSELAKLDDSYDWYVVRGENVVYYSQIGCYGDLHLILMDGAKLTTQGTFPLQCNGNMFIYGQSQGTGQLVATSNPAYGIFSQENITINGGTINATGGNFGISSFDGNVTINGGTVTAHGKDFYGVLAPNVIINGGSVTATSDTNEGIYVNSEGIVSIGGGSVNASYRGNVKIQPGKAFTTGTDDYIYCGTLTDDELAAINGKTLQPTTWDGGTTAETATVLTTPKHLELLAQCVNGGNDFSGKFFKLGGDITFDDATLTIDNDGDGTPESNHIAIGDETHAFAGTFDGQNYTINGLRITSASPRQGLFGSLGSTGVVKNVNLSDASIAGNDYTAGIVAHNSGMVANCQVDNTVALHCAQNYYDSFGGIVGYNAPKGIVSECTSSVTVTVADGVTAINHFGGVVGNNNSTVNGCLAVGVVIPDVNHHGAVVGLNQSDGILTANYYTACTVAGVENATNVGCNSSDIEGAKSLHSLTLSTGISTSTPAYVTYNEINYYAPDTEITVSYIGNVDNGKQITYKVNYGNEESLSVDEAGVFAMPSANATVEAVITIASFDGSGTEEDPYIIQYPSQLDLLAINVNSGNTYKGKFFKLANDITYDSSKLSIDNDGDGTPESNFVSIGTYVGSDSHYFDGTFNGDGHIISGIRLYKHSTKISKENYHQGLFGRLDVEATVKNVTLADAQITCDYIVGGIAGWNSGIINNCHVLNTVFIHGINESTTALGGIVGMNDGTISGCVSSVQLTNTGTQSSLFGGIAGFVRYHGSVLSNNLVIGATIPNTGYRGAIAGDINSESTFQNNYYTACSVAGVENATGVGYADSDTGNNYATFDLTANDGAVPALRDGADNSAAIELLAQVPEAFKPFKVSLAGRTLYKGGNWNTLCLPFDVTLAGSPLEGADVRELIPDESGLNGTTLTLNFTAANAVTELVAGKPYLIKWASGENIVNPKFTGVTIKSTTPENVASTDGKVTFKGIYSPISWDSENKSVLYLGAANTLYWPKPNVNPVTLNAFRAYFELADGVTASAFELNFDGETTGIDEMRNESNERNGSAWYTLDGRKFDSKPATKGVYIVNGRKVVIK